MDMVFLHILDLFGTAVFAITGAVRGVRSRLDFFGVIVMACIVGVGGGVLRDVLLGATPVSAYEHESYIIVCVLSGLLIFFIAPYVVGRWQIIAIGDAIGLGVFTALGSAKGLLYGAGPVGIVLSGVFSAIAGGVLRDILVRRTPAVLTNDFYATASLIGALSYLVLQRTSWSPFLHIILTASIVTTMRLIAMRLHLQLPKARAWAILAEDMDDYEKKQ